MDNRPRLTIYPVDTHDSGHIVSTYRAAQRCRKHPGPWPESKGILTMGKVAKDDGLDEGQAEIASIVGDTEGLIDDLRNAESCENAKDFRANLQNALQALDGLREDIKAALALVSL